MVSLKNFPTLQTSAKKMRGQAIKTKANKIRTRRINNNIPGLSEIFTKHFYQRITKAVSFYQIPDYVCFELKQ